MKDIIKVLYFLKILRRLYKKSALSSNISALYRDIIPGGKADDKKPSDFDQKQLKEGIRVELEHTSSPKIAQEIAMDHLAEDSKYYKKLRAVHLDKKQDLDEDAINGIPAKNYEGIPSGFVYVAMDGDDAGGQVERAARNNRIEDIADISNRIHEGSEAVKKEAESAGAKIVVYGGDDIGFLLPKKNIKHIEHMRNTYYQVAQFTITVGVGDTIPKAIDALLYGKLHGKNQTVLWNEDVKKFIDSLQIEHDEKQKILNSGVLEKNDWTNSYILHKKDQQPTVLYHYSRQPGLKSIDPKLMSSGAPGSFSWRFNHSKIKDFLHTSFHYIKDEPEDIVRGASVAKYILILDPQQHPLYDLSTDHKGLVKEVIKENQGVWNYENVLKKIKEAGYYGTWASKSDNPVIRNTVQLFHEHPINKEEGV